MHPLRRNHSDPYNFRMWTHVGTPAAVGESMNRSLAAALSVLTLVAFAGCTAPQSADEEDVATSGDALSEIIDEPAVAATTGAQPKVETIDLSTVDFDLATVKDSHGKLNLDLSKLKIDVHDTGRYDRDYNTPARGMKWVESDRRELPAFVDKFAHGIDVGGGGKCRITTISLKKVAVGCKWTW